MWFVVFTNCCVCVKTKYFIPLLQTKEPFATWALDDKQYYVCKGDSVIIVGQKANVASRESFECLPIVLAVWRSLR